MMGRVDAWDAMDPVDMMRSSQTVPALLEITSMKLLLRREGYED